MDERKAIWVQWLTLFGSMVGLPSPEDLSDESLRRFYKQLCLHLHPDKQSSSADLGHSERLVHFFQILSDVYDKYSKGTENLQPPDAAAFEENEKEVNHDGDGEMPKPSKGHSGRRVYLVTFSHPTGDGRRSPSEFARREFGELLVKAFEASVPNLRVIYAAVFQELHAAGATDAERNTHFHVSIKSSIQHSWAPIAAYLRREHHIYVHFAVSGEGYWSAFRYGWWPTKHKPLSQLDKGFVLLDGQEAHPPPDEAARRPFWSGRKQKRPTKQEPDSSASEDGDEKGGVQSNEQKTKREPVMAYAFRLIRDHQLMTGDSFLSLVQKLGDPRLISLCMQKSPSSLVEKARHVCGADARLKRSEQSREEILHQAAESPCTCDRPGNWKSTALQLLRLQKIQPVQFATAVMNALVTGASKGVNVFLHGTTTSGKSWILDPLRVIYTCHLTPAHKSGFPLQDLPLKEVILWQDLRLNEDVLPWSSLLLVFEGTEVSIRRPRTEFQGDLDFKVVQPVFVTSVAPLFHHDPEEQGMMNRRFIFFHFEKTVPAKQERKIPPCGSCFASMCLSFCSPPHHAPQLSVDPVPDVDASENRSSQSPSAADSELPRSASASSSQLSFCGDCGLPLLSSTYCRQTGKKHI